MKRSYLGKASGLTASSDGERSFWPSYADMMSAVALILFFLMLLAYIQNIITGNELTDTRDKLASTNTELETALLDLSITMGKVEDAEEELSKISIDLQSATDTLAEQELEIASRDAALAERNAQLEAQVNQLEAQRSQLASQTAQLDEQSAQLSSQALLLEGQTAELDRQQQLISQQAIYLEAANEELLAMRGQMQTIAVLRLTILEQIRDAIVSVMGQGATVSIGENGNLIISESILFDSGSSDVKDVAKPVLDRLEYVFSAFLAQSDNAKYVDSIVISGHTDSVGTDESNRLLSTDRANSVLNYIMSVKNGELGQYAQFFCAAGYGETRPVADNETEAGRAANRRIEISITLKDDSILEIVESYLDLQLPGT